MCDTKLWEKEIVGLEKKYLYNAKMHFYMIIKFI